LVDLNRLTIDREGRGARRGNRGRRRLVRGGIWVVVLLVLGWVLRAPLGRLYDQFALPEVEIARAVKTSPLQASAVSGTAANGYVVAARRAALSADTPGRVIEMNVEEGSVVKKGDVVARLYDAEYRAALRAAEAEVAAAESAVTRAEAQLAASRTGLETLQANVRAAEAGLADAGVAARQAKVDHERAVELLAKGAGTQQDVDDNRTRLDRAEATVRAEEARLAFARAAVAEGESRVAVAAAQLDELKPQVALRRARRDQAQATLDKTEIRAPFAGVVVLKDAEVGEVVSPNSQGGNSRGSVVTMVDFESLEVQVDMPERTLAGVRVGDRANIYLDAYPEVRYAGVVKRIWPTANRQKGSVELRVGFDAPDERLRPEMGVRVVFLPAGTDESGADATEAPVVVVPEKCVTRVDGETGVFALERDVARWRVVRLGEKRGGRVVVDAGLEGGETLVADPPPSLRDGARVRVAP